MGGYLLGTNHADTATLSTTTSGTMARPLTQLQVPNARGLMRGPTNNVGGAAVLVIRADLGEAKPVHCVGVAGLNGVTSVVGSVLYSATGAGNSELGIGDLLWDDAWETPYSQAVWHFPGNGTAGAAVMARYIQVSLEVYGRDIAERYVDARRLLIMGGMLDANGWDETWSMYPADLSTNERTPKGGVFVSQESGYREVRFGLSGRSKATMKTNTLDTDQTDSLQRALQRAGRHGEVVLCPRYYDDSADPEMFYNTLYATLQEWSPIVHQGGDQYACESIVGHEIPHPPLS
jgi:hypothetical protein